ncbi:MAG: AMP-binding protein [Gemmatimonadota bacterium]
MSVSDAEGTPVPSGGGWEGERAPGTPVNIAYQALTFHVEAGHGDRTALRWRPRSGAVVPYTYAELDRAAALFAGGLRAEGIGPGDTVAVLAGRIPELHVAVMGALRAGASATVLFASFGPEPIRRRLERGRARVLVATRPYFESRVVGIQDNLPELERIFIVDHPGALGSGSGVSGGEERVAPLCSWLTRHEPMTGHYPVDEGDPSLLHFTSGTTGDPKGVVHAHDAARAHRFTGRRVLGLQAGTRFWCTADPGWVTGISYGMMAPLLLGATLFLDEEEFDVDRWKENVVREEIEVLYTSPTALRLLRRLDPSEDPWGAPALRGLFTVGEPLMPAEAWWASRRLGVPVRDTWWQTETGCIVVATPQDEAPREGFVGRPVEGFETMCARRAPDGGVEPVAEGEAGELVIRRGWPSQFRTYLDRPDLYAASFAGEWYLSGDLMERDGEGWLRYVGRRDDLFNSAGHLVAPAEIEATLLRHPAVVDAGVGGRSDEVAGTVIEAWVVLAPDRTPDEDLRRDILRFAREELGPALAPRVLRFRDHLPRTPSGKILRRAIGRSVADTPDSPFS